MAERKKKTWINSITSSIPIILKTIDKKDLFTQSAALSYYCALSLAPFTILAILIFSFMGNSAEQAFTTQVQEVMGPKAAETVITIIQAADKNKDMRGISGILGLITLLISASAVFSQLKTTIVAIFSTQSTCAIDEPDQSWLQIIKDKVFSIGMMISFIFLSLVSLMISSALSIFLPKDIETFWQIINFGISFGIYTFVFFLIFFYVSSRKVTKLDALIGGSIASVLFIVGRSLISLYLVKSAVGSSYGAAGSLIVFLVWVYYSSFIVFISGVITEHLRTIRAIKHGTKK